MSRRTLPYSILLTPMVLVFNVWYSLNPFRCFATRCYILFMFTIARPTPFTSLSVRIRPF